MALLFGAASCAADNGTVTVTLPADAPDKVVVREDLVSDLVNAVRRTDLKTTTDTLEVKDGKMTISVDDRGPARYVLMLPGNASATLYSAPGENITVDIQSISPLKFTAAGTRLMEDITAIGKATAPFEEEYVALTTAGTPPTQEQINDFMARYDNTLIEFIKGNPNSPAVAYAILNLPADKFMTIFETMTPESKKSILYPYVEKQVQRNKDQIENEKKRSALTSGTIEAPAFTLKDLQGKDVSLSDFRGKWVVLDFWGSWCGWCVKGFPKLKEAYKQYDGKIEVIGIDCNETQEAWRAGVAKHELPWVNVYNPQDSKLLEQYLVEGFPTKVIVNPEGKIADITVGEDPAFYTKLASFVGSR